MVTSYQFECDPVANSTPEITERMTSRSRVAHIVTCEPANGRDGKSAIVRSHPSAASMRSATPPYPVTVSGFGDVMSYENPKSMRESSGA